MITSHKNLGLPCCTAHKQAPSANNQANTISDTTHCEKNINIVVVIDHMILGEGLTTLLKSFTNFSVCATFNKLIHAFEYIKDRNIDIIITEESIQDQSPYEFTRQVQTIPHKPKIMILFDKINDTQLERSIEAGISGCISKKEDFNGLIQAVNSIHSGEIFYSKDIKQRLISKDNLTQCESNYRLRKKLLSPRETEVLCCVAKGMKAKNIGENLQITPKTVERHKSNIMTKLDLHSQVDLAIYAVKEGYIEI